MVRFQILLVNRFFGLLEEYLGFSTVIMISMEVKTNIFPFFPFTLKVV